MHTAYAKLNRTHKIWNRNNLMQLKCAHALTYSSGTGARPRNAYDERSQWMRYENICIYSLLALLRLWKETDRHKSSATTTTIRERATTNDRRSGDWEREVDANEFKQHVCLRVRRTLHSFSFLVVMHTIKSLWTVYIFEARNVAHTLECSQIE